MSIRNGLMATPQSWMDDPRVVSEESGRHEKIVYGSSRRSDDNCAGVGRGSGKHRYRVGCDNTKCRLR